MCDSSTVIVEFGSGDASPVINSLKTRFNGIIHGFEINKLAYIKLLNQISKNMNLAINI